VKKEKIPVVHWITGIIRWNERSHPGFYTFGSVFEKHGAKLSSLDVAPTAANLSKASVYIIVDPDHIRDNPTPNFVTAKDVKAITDWVKAGGYIIPDGE
jgi:unsaturated rhamnogalacturonyl hydrolase